MKNGDKRPKTPAYIFFYLLFSPDSWRILMGVIFSAILTPAIVREDMTPAAVVVLYGMMVCIGWALTAKPAAWITGALKKILLQRR